jgi:hypothetical protein
MSETYRGLSFDGVEGTGKISIMIPKNAPILGSYRTFTHVGVGVKGAAMDGLEGAWVIYFWLNGASDRQSLDAAARAMIDHLLSGVEEKKVAVAGVATAPRYVVTSWACNKELPCIQFIGVTCEEVAAYLRDIGCQSIPYRGPVSFACNAKDISDGSILMECFLGEDKARLAVAAGRFHRGPHCGHPDPPCGAALVYVFYSADGNMAKIWRGLKRQTGQ